MSEGSKCSICDQPAKVFVSYVADGNVVQVVFCGEHAEWAGVFDPRAYGLIAEREAEVEAPREVGEGPTCDVCGFSHFDFEKQGRLGCPSCYEAFGAVLRPLVAKMQAGPKHFGKIPRKAIEKSLLDERIRYLEGKLDDAVEGERYEEAARFRDKISEIKAIVENP